MPPRRVLVAPSAAFAPCGLEARTFAAKAVPPLVLVLDLDETLLRAVVHGIHKNRTLANVDVEVTIPVGTGVSCDISFRPGLAAFFDWVRQRRSEGVLEGPWVFAQGQPAYVNAVLPSIDVDGSIFSDRVLTQKHCTVPKRAAAYNLKDLSKVPLEGGGENHLSRMVLVDNNAISMILNPDNALMCTDWEGDGKADTELARVSARLDALIADVQGSANGFRGDYAERLVATTPGHALFKERLRTLHAKLEAGPSSISPKKMKLFLTDIWDDVCDVKRELLGVQESEH